MQDIIADAVGDYSTVDQGIEDVVQGAGESIADAVDNLSNVDQVIESVVNGAGGSVEDDDSDFISKDMVTIWMKNPFVKPYACTRAVNIVRRLPGPVNNAKHAKTPITFFELMIDEQIVDIIVTNTNAYIDTIASNFLRERDYKRTYQSYRNQIIDRSADTSTVFSIWPSEP